MEREKKITTATSVYFQLWGVRLRHRCIRQVVKCVNRDWSGAGNTTPAGKMIRAALSSAALWGRMRSDLWALRMSDDDGERRSTTSEPNVRDGECERSTITGDLKQMIGSGLRVLLPDTCACCKHAQTPLCCCFLSDEEHLARCHPFIVCHRYHLGNDLFWPVAMVTVICMEIRLVPVKDEEAADVTGSEAWILGWVDAWPW